ncbi:MAG: hypothetical protein RLZZ599_1485 [Bacteroidota bacterium]|jgi:hypothetical protein
MKVRLLTLFTLISFFAWAQPAYIAIVSGTVTDSATGMPLSNYPVFIADSSNSMQTPSVTLFTDANGYYSDSIALYATNGVLMQMVEDSCTGNMMFAYTPYGNAITPTIFTVSTYWSVCNGPGGGGGGGGSGTFGGCNASFSFDSVLTGMGQIVLYNTSTVDSTLQNATIDYFWNWDDGSVSYGAYPSHQYTNSGDFLICLTMEAIDSSAMGVYACTSTYCDTISIDSTGNVYYKGTIVNLNVYSPDQMGLSELSQELPLLYPNPSRGSVNIQLTEPALVSIYTVSGQLIQTQEGTQTLTFENLKQGAYVVRTQGVRNSSTQKLMVQ